MSVVAGNSALLIKDGACDETMTLTFVLPVLFFFQWCRELTVYLKVLQTMEER